MAPAANGSEQSPHPLAASLPGLSLYQLDITLQTADGQAIPLSSFRGAPLLVTMFYSHCTSVCPMLTAELQGLYRQLTPPQQARFSVLMVSFDAERDTPAELKAFKEQHSIHEAGWVIARARAEDVRALAAVLGIRYRELADRSFNHSAVIAVADSEGVIRGRTTELRGDPTFIALVRHLSAIASTSRAAGE
jgi:protein SCO1/2